MKKVLATWNQTLDKIAKIDWAKVKTPPAMRLEKFDQIAFGAEVTWKYSGPGLSIGFLKWDIWLGWPDPENYTATQTPDTRIVAA